MKPSKKSRAAAHLETQKEIQAKVVEQAAPPETSAVINFRLLKAVVPLGTFVLALGGYSLTMARTVTLVDSGELILSCATLGVAHPPGMPFYTILGHLFSKLPIGTMALRVTLMSAVCAAVAAALLSLVVVEVNQLLREQVPLKKGRLGGVTYEQAAPAVDSDRSLLRLFHWVMPVCVGLALAFSVTLWFYGSVAEVYSLNIALLAAVVYLMIRWQRDQWSCARQSPPPESRWILPTAAVVYGLALGVHHATVVLTFPAFVWLVWRTAGIRYFRSRQVLVAFGAGLAAIVLVYLYLPLAAGRGPIMNWGNPTTLERFYWHISGRQYQSFLFSSSTEEFSHELKFFLELLWRQFTPLGLAGAMVGLGVLWKKQRVLFGMLALMIALNVAFALNFNNAEDKDAYYLPTFLAVAMALGIGTQDGFHWLMKRGTAAAFGLLVLVVALPAANFMLHRFENDKSRYLIARDYVENALSSVEPGGLMLTMDWQLYSPYLYLRHIENFRHDATVVDVGLVRRSWYVEGYLPREYPEMMRACSAEAKDYLEDLRLFEEEKPYDGNRINTRFLALLNGFVKFHVANHAAYTTLPMEEGIGAGYTWIPQGLTIRFLPKTESPTNQVLPSPTLNLRGLLDHSIFLDEVVKDKVLPAYATMTANRGKYLSLNGRQTEAFDQLNLALQLNPGFDRTYEFMGDIYTAQGMLGAASDAYQTALRLNPNNKLAWQHLQSLTPKP